MTGHLPRSARRLLAVPAMAVLATAVSGPALAQGTAEPIVAYKVVNGRAIPESLTGAPGDPERGRAVFQDARASGCTACHMATGATGAPVGGYGTGGLVAPAGEGRTLVSLDGVGARLDPGEIRLWLVDPGAIDPRVAMPGFYLPGQRTGLDDPLYNGPRLSAQAIEDLVAWLATLRADRAPE